jgi:hypothetical protein
MVLLQQSFTPLARERKDGKRMKLRLKVFLGVLAVAVLSAVLLVPIAGASGWGTNTNAGSLMSSGSSGMMGGGGWCGGGIWNGSGSWGGTGMWGTGFGMRWLTSNPDALQAWLQLRADHLAALQTWYDTYKADLKSAAAQQALHDLWTTYWNDLKAFYEQYAGDATWTCPADGMWGGWDMGGMMGGHDWDAHHMWGTGHGAAWMANHPGAFGQWLTMRGKQTAGVRAWSQKYHGALKSSAAWTAMQTMRAHQRTQVRSFYRNHHLTITTSRMRFGAGGWMGLGGMWGGWGW